MSLRLYAAVFRTALQERLAYRWNLFAQAAVRFAALAAQLVLFGAAAGGHGEIAGYTLPALAGYFYLTYVARGFSAMAGMDRVIVQEIRDGTLSAFLVRPISYLGYHVAYRVAHKAVFFGSAAIPYLAVFLLLDRLYGLEIAGEQVPLAIVSLALGFCLGFLIMFLVGIGSFWLLEASAFAFIVQMIEYFLSGHMFPLDMLPWGLKDAAMALPFAYETYFPVAVFLGKIHGAALWSGLAIQAAWVAALLAIVAAAWRRGLARYLAAGG